MQILHKQLDLKFSASKQANWCRTWHLSYIQKGFIWNPWWKM